MFKAMTDCQALHPDPTDSLSDGEKFIPLKVFASVAQI